MAPSSEGPHGQLFRIGGPIDSTVARLRLVGDDLDPDEVTSMLGCRPTEAARKGERRPNRSSRPLYARRGIWLLQSAEDEKQPLEAHITALLDQVTADPEVWRTLQERFEVDIDVGLFLEDDNREFWLSPEVVKALGDRGIGLDVDIYALLGDDE
ncbi:MAG TPA: DUF4279 domain-containing protein [Chloroflexota bacterium]